MSHPTLINELLPVIVLIVEKGPRTETFYYFVNFARDKLKKSVTVLNNLAMNLYDINSVAIGYG